MHQNCPGRIMKNSFLGHNLGVSDSAGLKQGPRICLPNKFPGDAEAAHWTSIHVFSSHSDLDEKRKIMIAMNLPSGPASSADCPAHCVESPALLWKAVEGGSQEYSQGSLRTSLAQWLKNPPANAGNTGAVRGTGRFHVLCGICVPNNWDHTLESETPSYRAHMLQLLKPRLHKRSHHNEKPAHHN